MPDTPDRPDLYEEPVVTDLSTTAKPGKEPEGKARRQRVPYDMFLTVFLAAAVIIGGFLTPAIFSTVMDSDRGAITLLSGTGNEDLLLHVFDEPVSLYPWNLYDADNTSDLTYADRYLLMERRVASFLIINMTEFGMDISQLQPDAEQAPTEFAAPLIIDAFSFLRTDDATEQGCFVIYALDINGDEVPDVRCAVDQNGTIISLEFLSKPWEEIDSGTVTGGPGGPGSDATGGLADATGGATDATGGLADATGGLAEENAALSPEADTTNAADTTGAGTPADATAGGTAAGGPDGGAALAEGPDGGAAATGGSDDEAAATGGTSALAGLGATEESPYALALDELERVPVGEDLAMWSFVHLLALSAEESGQHELATAAALLDAGFANKYANPDDIEAVAQTPPILPTPTIFATEEYFLYIYDLPTNVRFILYYDPVNSRCVGFNLQL